MFADEQSAVAQYPIDGTNCAARMRSTQQIRLLVYGVIPDIASGLPAMPLQKGKTYEMLFVSALKYVSQIQVKINDDGCITETTHDKRGNCLRAFVSGSCPNVEFGWMV
jgi:hypothetical protein